MPHNAAEAEKSARRLLERQGFLCCPEPAWIKHGKKPDFFCTGPADIWVEVKSLGQTPAEEKFDQVLGWFESRREIDGPGASINAAYMPDVTEQDVKEALIRVRRLLKRCDRAQYDHLVVTIPRDPDYKKDTEFVLRINDQDVLILSAGSGDGRYGCSSIDTMRIYDDHPVKVREAGSERNTTAGQLGLDEEDLRLAVIVTPWKRHEISGCPREIGDAEIGWPDAKRFLNDAKNAARKFKNALIYKKAPTVIFCVSELDSPASCKIRIVSLKAMLYGVLTLVRTSPSSDGDNSSVIHGQEAFWTTNKNKSVSAACYVSNGKPICILHNPWAEYPLPTGLIGCPEYRGLENGKIVRVR